MGCSTSQAGQVASTSTIENGINEQAEGERKYPPGEAFEVPLDEEADSIIKKHPPKRIQQLVDAQSTQPTLEELEEKLANAEIRRNQFLMDRVTTLKSKEDESINDENSNEMENNEKQPDISATDEENSHNISNNDTQENHSN